MKQITDTVFISFEESDPNDVPQQMRTAIEEYFGEHPQTVNRITMHLTKAEELSQKLEDPDDLFQILKQGFREANTIARTMNTALDLKIES